MAMYSIEDTTLTAIANAIRGKNGSSSKYTPAQMATAIAAISGGGGGLPTGIAAMKYGTVTIASDIMGASTFQVTHGLGETPDMFMIWSPVNVATTYSILAMVRGPQFAWRGSTYLTDVFYHGNSTTTVTGTSCTTSYGIKTLNGTSAVITSYSTSTSYGWRAGTYNWIALKFS